MYFYILFLTQTLCCTSFTESRFQERFSNMGDRRWNTDSTLADFDRINDALRSQWCSLESTVSEGLSRPFFAPNFQSFFDDEKWYQEDEETKEDDKKDKSEADTNKRNTNPPTEKNEEEAKEKKQNPEGKPVVNEYETTTVEEDDETGQKRVTKTAVKEVKDSYTDKNGAKITKVAYSQKSSSVTM